MFDLYGSPREAEDERVERLYQIIIRERWVGEYLGKPDPPDYDFKESYIPSFFLFDNAGRRK